MIGGEDGVVERLYPLFATIAPGVGSAGGRRDGRGAETGRTGSCTAVRTAPATS